MLGVTEMVRAQARRDCEGQDACGHTYCVHTCTCVSTERVNQGGCAVRVLCVGVGSNLCKRGRFSACVWEPARAQGSKPGCLGALLRLDHGGRRGRRFSGFLFPGAGTWAGLTERSLTATPHPPPPWSVFWEGGCV